MCPVDNVFPARHWARHMKQGLSLGGTPIDRTIVSRQAQQESTQIRNTTESKGCLSGFIVPYQSSNTHFFQTFDFHYSVSGSRTSLIRGRQMRLFCRSCIAVSTMFVPSHFTRNTCATWNILKNQAPMIKQNDCEIINIWASWYRFNIFHIVGISFTWIQLTNEPSCLHEQQQEEMRTTYVTKPNFNYIP